jgi:hypothetical protein
LAGFEPATFGSSGKYTNHYTNKPNKIPSYHPTVFHTNLLIASEAIKENTDGKTDARSLALLFMESRLKTQAKRKKS